MLEARVYPVIPNALWIATILNIKNRGKIKFNSRLLCPVEIILRLPGWTARNPGSLSIINMLTIIVVRPNKKAEVFGNFNGFLIVILIGQSIRGLNDNYFAALILEQLPVAGQVSLMVTDVVY